MNKIRAGFGALLRKIGFGFSKLANLAYTDSREEAKQRYLEDEKRDALRLRYDLGPQSTVVDVGGYEGQWASDIYSMYRCRIEVFEPIPDFAKRIRERFRQNPDICIHEAGLGPNTGDVTMNLQADGTSQFRGSGATCLVHMQAVAEAFKDLPPDIDLMKINIEGGEYDLLESMIKHDLAKRVKNLQIQFHDHVPNAKERMKTIQRELAKTHKTTYQYQFVWENWQRL